MMGPGTSRGRSEEREGGRQQEEAMALTGLAERRPEGGVVAGGGLGGLGGSCEIREWPCSRRSCRERGCQEVSQEGVSASRKHSCPPGQEGPDAGRGGAGFRGSQGF